MSGHTPGPWSFAGRLGAGFLIEAPTAPICVVYNSPAAAYDTIMIVHAPDLALALRKIAGLPSRGHMAAAKAIAEAALYGIPHPQAEESTS